MISIWGPTAWASRSAWPPKPARCRRSSLRTPTIAGDHATLADLQRLARDGVIGRHLVIERGGIRFGIFGVLGKEAIFYTTGGAASFSDPIETAKEMVTVLRETEKADVVICLSHGGLEQGKDGRFTDGDDVRLAKAVPGIDVVIGGHSHTALQEAIIVNDHTPVVQTGKEGENLGELVVSLDGGKLTVESYRLYPIDATIAADRDIAEEIDKLKKAVTEAVFASRGYSIDQPLAVVDAGHPQYVHRHCRQHAARQSRHRRLQKRHRGGHRIYRQRADARRVDAGNVGRANRLRCIRRGAPRRRRRGYDGRQRACDQLLHRPGTEAFARVPARGQPRPPRRVFPPLLRDEVPLRPVAPEGSTSSPPSRSEMSIAATARSTSPGRTSGCIALPAPCILG